MSTTEWGVKHSQGIRTEPSERAARESLEWLTERYNASSRDKVRPVIVSRTVTAWAEPTPNPTADTEEP